MTVEEKNIWRRETNENPKQWKMTANKQGGVEKVVTAAFPGSKKSHVSLLNSDFHLFTVAGCNQSLNSVKDFVFFPGFFILAEIRSSWCMGIMGLDEGHDNSIILRLIWSD